MADETNSDPVTAETPPLTPAPAQRLGRDLTDMQEQLEEHGMSVADVLRIAAKNYLGITLTVRSDVNTDA